MEIVQKISQTLRQNPEQRRIATRNSLAYFMAVYLSHYMRFPTPDFQLEMIQDLENDDIKFLEIIAFRGSAKSTIGGVAYVLWRALHGLDPFIVLVSDTHTQAKQAITNIIHELEDNSLILRDFGAQQAYQNEWTATNIVLPNNVRIMARSRGQKIRGLRHMQYRPTLAILDDIENLQAVRTIEQRDLTEQWLLSDVLPSMDSNARVILLGNLLHSDSLVSRIRSRIEKKEMQGILRMYPLMDDSGASSWAEAYPVERIKELEAQGKRHFTREYQLQIVEADDHVISEIGRYDTPPKKEDVSRIAIGVDLAISQKLSADFTALTASAKVGKKIYTLRTKYGRFNFNQTLDVIQQFYLDMKTIYPGVPITVGIEDVAYQRVAIEEAKRRFPGIPIVAIKQSVDKRTNLESFAPAIEGGEILVRAKGHEDLVIQTVHFGYEAHDDLLDSAMISWRMLLEAPSGAGLVWL